MKKRNYRVIITAGLLICLTVIGYVAVAAEYGSKEDPLVTLSYITGVLTPETNTKIDKAYSDTKALIEAEIVKKMQELNTRVDKKLTDFEGKYTGTDADSALIDAIAAEVAKKLAADGATNQATWQVVSLGAGKTITAEVGCQVLLRIGASKCVSSGSVGLINLSNGSNLSNGGSLVTNNLYMVTIDGRGIKAAAKSTLLVNGKYTIK